MTTLILYNINRIRMEELLETLDILYIVGLGRCLFFFFFFFGVSGS